MTIYQKNLRRFGMLLIVVSILDTTLELAFYPLLLSSRPLFINQLLTPLGICMKDGLGLLTGLLACVLFRKMNWAKWILPAVILLVAAEVPVILISTRSRSATRIDGLINVTLVLSAMVVYTALQLKRSDRIWRRVCSSKPAVLDLKLKDGYQWFNPIEIGPKLELNEEIASVVNRFLETSKSAVPLEITIACPTAISKPLQETMQEVFQMYYEDEERRVNHYLEGRYIRAMALVIISIVAVTIWINFSPSTDESVTWTILSNFAAFSLWQIGNTYFERSDGYEELLRAMIARQAKLRFWAE